MRVLPSSRSERRRPRAAGPALAVLCLAALAAAGCAREVLVSIPQAYQHVEDLRGSRVRVEGTVRRFQGEGGEHYVLEDAESNRVGLSGPVVARLAALEGRRCQAAGELHFDPRRGYYLEADWIDTPGALR